MKILMIAKHGLFHNEYQFFNEYKELLYITTFKKNCYQLKDKKLQEKGTIQRESFLSDNYLMSSDTLNPFLIKHESAFSNNYILESLNWRLTIPSFKQTSIITDLNNESAIAHMRYSMHLHGYNYFIDITFDENIELVLLTTIMVDLVYITRSSN